MGEGEGRSVPPMDIARDTLLMSFLHSFQFMKKSKEDREKIEEQEKYAQVFESEQVLEDKG